MSIREYKALLADLDHAKSLQMKKKILIKLTDVKRRISVKSHDKFSDLPAELGTSIQGKFCRGAYLKYRDTPLGTGPGKSRFLGEKDLESPLYFASNEYAVFPERRETGFDIVEPHFRFWVSVLLVNVLDLTSAEVRKSLGMTRYEVEKIEWVAWGEILCPTQILGRKAFETGYEAILFNSARHGDTKNLAVFPKNLNKKKSSIIIQDSHNNFKISRIP